MTDRKQVGLLFNLYNVVVKNNRVVVIGTAVASVIALGFAADAAHQHRHSLRVYLDQCNDPGYYYKYSRWCAALFRVARIDRTKTYTKEYGAYSTVNDRTGAEYVTIRRDPQASNDFRPDGYIAMQTASDVARSPEKNGGLGWVPSIQYFGWVHPPLLTVAQANRAERQEARKVVTTTTTTRYVKPAQDLSVCPQGRTNGLCDRNTGSH
jgi:hypothetical protein